jgi:hypothetical protein
MNRPTKIVIAVMISPILLVGACMAFVALTHDDRFETYSSYRRDNTAVESIVLTGADQKAVEESAAKMPHFENDLRVYYFYESKSDAVVTPESRKPGDMLKILDNSKWRYRAWVYPTGLRELQEQVEGKSIKIK